MFKSNCLTLLMRLSKTSPTSPQMAPLLKVQGNNTKGKQPPGLNGWNKRVLPYLLTLRGTNVKSVLAVILDTFAPSTEPSFLEGTIPHFRRTTI